MVANRPYFSALIDHTRGIQQGITLNSRVGNTINVKRMSTKYIYNPIFQASQNTCYLRVVQFYFRTNIVPNASLLFLDETDPLLSPINPKVGSILMDRTIILKTDLASRRNIYQTLNVKRYFKRKWMYAQGADFGPYNCSYCTYFIVTSEQVNVVDDLSEIYFINYISFYDA